MQGKKSYIKRKYLTDIFIKLNKIFFSIKLLIRNKLNFYKDY